MRCYWLVFTILFVLPMLDLTSSSKQVRCRTNAECDSKSMCCKQGICASRERGCPCYPGFCPKGEQCYLQQVQCFVAPCPPIPSCRRATSGSY